MEAYHEKHLKSLLTLFLVFVVSFSLSLGVLGASVTVKRYTQDKSNWCWAACALMLACSQGADEMSQSDIVTYVKGSAVNEMGTIVETEQAVRYVANNSFSTIKGTDSDGDSTVITMAAIKSKINSGFPVILGLCSVGNENDGGHMVVGYGYINIGANPCVNYKDPSNDAFGNDTSSYVSYDDMTSAEGAFMKSQTERVILTSYLSVLE